MTSSMFPNPKHVQQVVFQKMDALRQRKAGRDAADRQQAVVDTLQVYDELRLNDSQLKMRTWSTWIHAMAAVSAFQAVTIQANKASLDSARGRVLGGIEGCS